MYSPKKKFVHKDVLTRIIIYKKNNTKDAFDLLKNEGQWDTC